MHRWELNLSFVMIAEHGKPHGLPVKAGRPQGRLLTQGVKEAGESKGPVVMTRIRGNTLLRKEAHFQLVR